MPEASVSLQILPLGVPKKKIIEIVDRAVKTISRSSINYSVGPFETTMEGNLDVLMDIVSEAVRISSKNGENILANVKINYCTSGVLTIKEKLENFR